MKFESWQAFWAMGGYGFFVWLSFGISFLAMALLILDSLWAKKKLREEVLAQQARKQRIEEHTHKQKRQIEVEQ